VVRCAISVTVDRLKRIVDIVIIGVSARLAVQIDGIINTVIVRINIE